MTGCELWYFEVWWDMVLKDFDTIPQVEVNLNDFDFTAGDIPEEFMPKPGIIYRFVLSKAA